MKCLIMLFLIFLIISSPATAGVDFRMGDSAMLSDEAVVRDWIARNHPVDRRGTVYDLHKKDPITWKMAVMVARMQYHLNKGASVYCGSQPITKGE